MIGAGRALAVILSLISATTAMARTVQGKFGRALVAGSTAHADVNPVYGVVPITIECWAKIPAKSAEVVLVANEPRSSASHWELFVEKETGRLGTILPNYKPNKIVST